MHQSQTSYTGIAGPVRIKFNQSSIKGDYLLHPYRVPPFLVSTKCQNVFMKVYADESGAIKSTVRLYLV